MYTHEDVHFTKKNYIQMDQEDNNLGVLEQEPVLEILCGMVSGKLYLNKYRADGRTKPFKVNDSWNSLAEFQSIIGKSKTRNWKKSVTYCVVPLGLQMDLLNGRRLMEEPVPQEDCEEPNLESRQMVDDLFEKVYLKLKSELEDLIHQKLDDVLIQAIAPLKDMFEGTTSELSKKPDSLNRRVSVLEEKEVKIAPS